jgi:hypothetical protein
MSIFVLVRSRENLLPRRNVVNHCESATHWLMRGNFRFLGCLFYLTRYVRSGAVRSCKRIGDRLAPTLFIAPNSK